MMQPSRLSRRLELVGHVGRSGLILRALILLAPLAALVCVHLATSDGFTGDTIVLDGLVVALTAICLIYPDGHAGFAVLTVLTIEWLIHVDDPASWWSLAMAATFAVFHSALAAASVAPPGASWTPAMARRWARRTAVLLVASGGTALAVQGASHLELSANVLVLTAALVALAAGGLWVVTEQQRTH